MVSFGEVVNFDPEQIREIFSMCSAHQQTCDDLNTHVKKLSDLHTWEGDAAKAAKDSAGKTHGDIAAHGQEAWKIAAAARDCYDEGVALKNAARQVQADADAKGLAIDPVSGRVTDPNPPNMRGWANEDKLSYYAEIKAVQVRVNNVISDAERFDDDLAAAINAADGSIPLTPKGEGDNVNLADRRANQVAAYRKTYGKSPVTSNDWRMAEALDPHTYDPKYKGALSNVMVARIRPDPGHGVSRANLYIPGKEVQNATLNPADIAQGRGLPHNLGDHRGPDPSADAEHSRVSLYIDHENGLVLARQNPTIVSSGPNIPKAGMPRVEAIQTEDGAVRVRYFGTDTYQPKLATAANIGVEGDLAFQPHPSGAVSAGGNITAYPSAEIYNYGTDGSVSTLADYRATSGQSGPLNNLWLGPVHNIGADMRSVPEIYQPDPAGGRNTLETRQPSDIAGTPLGSPGSPPSVKVVGDQ